MPEVLITAFVGFFAAAIPALFGWLTHRRAAATAEKKTAAEVDVAVAGAWQGFVKPLQEELAVLRDRVSELQERINGQEQQLAVQRSQLEQQEQHEEKLRQKLAEVFDWVENGAVPPPPVRPAWLKK